MISFSYPVSILTVVHLVLAAALSAVAPSSRPPSSLLAVAGPRGPSVWRADSARRRPVAAPSATSYSTSHTEVRSADVNCPRLHGPHHGRLVLDDQGVVRLASREAIPQLSQARFKGAPWCSSQNRQSVAAVAEAPVQRPSRSGVVVIHAGVLSPAVGATFLLGPVWVTSAKNKQTNWSVLCFVYVTFYDQRERSWINVLKFLANTFSTGANGTTVLGTDAPWSSIFTLCGCCCSYLVQPKRSFC